ncbi:CDGSH iron-sulfur domain-containing protein [Nocardioides sp. R-C-SC26]|uniref:CDGSH iron-sulfur domain-containing protein n=1 Tax=Nocardioides sp. R-C-SC26 TaxID=2870414 RepID=UPI001E648051|nr:CDGSH iron-sulfur domain-containing protein [Nocardioides sp. R-C-SC26]
MSGRSPDDGSSGSSASQLRVAPPDPRDATSIESGTLPHADVVLCPGGPMLLRGDVVVQDAEGNRHRTTRPVSAVCRCLKSADLPWCDGTHQLLPPGKRP